MSTLLLSSRLQDIYPTARIRARRMTRLPETYLDWMKLDATTADEMGREQIGWFVGNHPGIARLAEQLGRLDSNPEGGVWIVVPLGRDVACDLFVRWPHGDCAIAPPGSNQKIWRSRKVWVAVPEELQHLLPLARAVTPGVAGVIVFDPPCLMYRARGGTDSWGHCYRNDRPQRVVDFQADLSCDGWQPPLILLTERPAKSVTTEAVARAFCLNGFRFVAGDSFGCWDEAVE